MINLKNFNTKELEKVNELLENVNNLEEFKEKLKKELDERHEEESKSLNCRMTTEFLLNTHNFDNETYQVLKKHNINNLQDLIDFDLNNLRGTIPYYMFENLEYISKSLDMRAYEARMKEEKETKEEKGKKRNR